MKVGLPILPKIGCRDNASLEESEEEVHIDHLRTNIYHHFV